MTVPFKFKWTLSGRNRSSLVISPPLCRQNLTPSSLENSIKKVRLTSSLIMWYLSMSKVLKRKRPNISQITTNSTLYLVCSLQTNSRTLTAYTSFSKPSVSRSLPSIWTKTILGECLSIPCVLYHVHHLKRCQW